MPNEVLRNGEGEPLPQRKKEGATVNPAEGDDNAWEVDDGNPPALGSKSDAPESDTSNDASLISWIQGLISTIKGGITVAVSALPNVTIGGETVGLAKDNSVQALAAYEGQPQEYDLTANTPHTVNCDGFQIPDGSNTVRTVQLTPPGGNQVTITVATNQIIPQAVESVDGGGTASTFVAYNQ